MDELSRKLTEKCTVVVEHFTVRKKEYAVRKGWN
jgi:hypothetical protein